MAGIKDLSNEELIRISQKDVSESGSGISSLSDEELLSLHANASSKTDPMSVYKEAIQQSIDVKHKILSDNQLIELIEKVSDICVTSLQNGGKILFCGNGGSAADAQHLAAELSGRFYFDREPLNAEALHVNTSFLTAVAND